MAALTVQNILAPFAAVGAGAADFTFAAGSTDGDTFQCTGREVLIAYNSGVGAATITIASVADEKGRTGDITTYSMAAGDYAVFGVGLTNAQGWKTSAGLIAVDVSAADIKWAVLRLPAGFPA